MLNAMNTFYYMIELAFDLWMYVNVCSCKFICFAVLFGISVASETPSERYYQACRPDSPQWRAGSGACWVRPAGAFLISICFTFNILHAGSITLAQNSHWPISNFPCDNGAMTLDLARILNKTRAFTFWNHKND